MAAEYFEKIDIQKMILKQESIIFVKHIRENEAELKNKPKLWYSRN